MSLRDFRFLLVFATFLPIIGFGQGKLTVKLPKLFVHFDKNVYTNNEIAWFTGYLLEGNPEDADKHRILSVALVRDRDSAIIKQDKYVIDGGLAMGCMILPDSLVAGNYHFLATTNRTRGGIPDVFFRQPLLIKSNFDAPYIATLKLMELESAGTNHHVLLAVTTRDARFLPTPVDVTYRYGKTSRKAKTNRSGELLFELSEQPDLSDHNVYVKLNYGKDSTFLNLPIPVKIKRAHVKFYPEGGQLIDDVPTTVAWEVKDQQLATITLKAKLYENDSIIDTIETNAYGIGKFRLRPVKNAVYSVKLIHSAFADSTYTLPKILADGVGISIANAAVKDTLRVILQSSTPQKVKFVLSNANELFPGTEIQLGSSRRLIKLPLSELTTGLHQITISDSLGRPLAERMFFSHYDPVERLTISTNKSVFAQREQVTLKLNMVGPDTVGLVSIACVQENRLSARLTTDLESYAYLASEMADLPIALTGRGFESREYVDDLLLTRGWRRYTWQEKNTNPSKSYDSLALHIVVKRQGKKLIKPINISYFKDKEVGILTTNSAGELTIPDSVLLTGYGKKFNIMAGNSGDSHYTIDVADAYLQSNKRFARMTAFEQRSVPSSIQNNNELIVSSKEKINRLQEIVIKASNDKSIHYNGGLSGTNACGDYVCTSNILNCPNHFGSGDNTQPLRGRQYRDPLTRGTITYSGCTVVDNKVKIQSLDPIYTQKEFYVSDHSDLQEPATESTIYWNHGKLLNSKTQEITFYTSDITGRFRIVVQGITDKNYLFGQYGFEVKAK
ncbi:MAG: hypothetical protein EOO20_06890 [Chryseobacterium sp.]|nr:MAG: hypothetical protein EOO20_06890 [Chryseobacterium sp.]